MKGSVTNKSSDTDVLVLAIHYFPKLKAIEALWIEKGKVTATADLRTLVPVHEICSNIDETVPQILPAIHALTGCDSTSSFYGVGKKKVWKTIQMLCAKRSLPSLDHLNTDDITQAIEASRIFIASLYDPAGRFQDSHGDLSKLRIELIGRDTPLQRIPPSEPSFEEHVKRVVYQVKIWLSSHEAKPDIPSPEGNGWYKMDVWKPKRFDGPTAAEMLVELLCSCRGRSPCASNCTCTKNGALKSVSVKKLINVNDLSTQVEITEEQ